MFTNKNLGFFSALSFLSRLGMPLSLKQDFAAGLLWYGTAGAFLGLLCSLGALLPILLNYMNSLPIFLLASLCALTWLSLEVWLSRALHWDGLADLGDALGSNGEGKNFVKVLMDSRLGTFGALLLILSFLWQLLFLASLYYKALSLSQSFSLMLLPILACAWSRIAPLWLAKLAKARTDSFLGKELCKALSPGIFLLACLQGLLTLFIAWLCNMAIMAIITLVFFQFVLLRFLSRIANKRSNGLSGDFFGACIVLSQLSFLACACFGTP